MGKFDQRGFNITNEDEAIEFIELVAAKAPQIKRVLSGHKLKVQSLLNRAEFAEGQKKEAIDAASAVVDEHSIGDRITGRAPTETVRNTTTRLEQLRNAQAPAQAPQSEVFVPLTSEDNKLASAVQEGMVTSEEDDEIVSNTVVAPGTIGALNLPNTQPHEEKKTDEAPAITTGPVDLMAMAQKEEEEIAAKAGTSPSEHAADDGVQSKDTDDAQVYNQFQVGDDVFQHLIGSESNDNTYLKNDEVITHEDYVLAVEADKKNETTGAGDRIAQVQQAKK